MKKFFIAFGCLLWAICAHAQMLSPLVWDGGTDNPFPRFTAKQSLDSNTVLTTAIDITGATLVVVAIVHIGVGPVFNDTLGNTYTPLTEQNSFGTHIRLYYTVPTVTGLDQWSITAGGENPSIAVMVFNDTKVTSPFDVQNGSTTGATGSIQPGSVTPSIDNELVVYALTANGGSASDVPSVDIGTIPIGLNLMFTANAASIAFAYQKQTTATAVNPTWSWPNLHFNGAVIATFKPTPPPPSYPVFDAGGRITLNVGGSLLCNAC